MASRPPPLSPHLQIYRPQVTSILSIVHRMTGVGLFAGLLVLAYWLSAAAYGPEAFARAQVLLGSIIGRLVLLGITVALFYHLCNGVRHLAWDVGWGYELPRLRASGAVVVVATLVLTVVVWVMAYAARGGA
jgi:succinate dehydrogenase / fumarate reductase cytochrome b subunit